MTAYYNEIDPYAAAWLRNLIAANLIAPGVVDERPIQDVKPYELAGYTQCHFFAGIGGWSYALRLAGWPDHRPVWTGSCPCQPFSLAGKRGGFTDDRHLWPYWRYFIAQRRPARVFGEQVASAGDWLRLVRGDLEAMDYAVGAIPMEAASTGADTRRDRFFLIAHATSDGCEGVQQRPQAQISEDGAPEALAARDTIGNPFADWRQLMARTEIRRLPDGVSSNVAVRPSLRGFGNAIDPICAATFIRAAS